MLLLIAETVSEEEKVDFFRTIDFGRFLPVSVSFM